MLDVKISYFKEEELLMKTAVKICAFLLVIGGLNWGLVGLFNFDIVAAIFGDMTILSRIVYTLIGISAVIELFRAFKK